MQYVQIFYDFLKSCNLTSHLLTWQPGTFLQDNPSGQTLSTRLGLDAADTPEFIKQSPLKTMDNNFGQMSLGRILVNCVGFNVGTWMLVYLVSML